VPVPYSQGTSCDHNRRCMHTYIEWSENHHSADDMELWHPNEPNWLQLNTLNSLLEIPRATKQIALKDANSAHIFTCLLGRHGTEASWSEPSWVTQRVHLCWYTYAVPHN